MPFKKLPLLITLSLFILSLATLTAYSKDNNTYTVRPTTKAELIKIINNTLKKNGSKANLNFIDTSLITDMSGMFSNTRQSQYKNFAFLVFLQQLIQNE